MVTMLQTITAILLVAIVGFVGAVAVDRRLSW